MVLGERLEVTRPIDTKIGYLQYTLVISAATPIGRLPGT